MEKTFSFLETDPTKIQQDIQDYNDKKTIKTKSIKQELKNLGYHPSNNEDIYEKNWNGLLIIACRNGTGVILHIADKNGNILTNVGDIHPSIQIDDPQDISKAENDLIRQIPTASSGSSSLTN